MDVAKYIKSGKLEAYVLGKLSDKEAQEVADYAHKYPEISKQIQSLSTLMGQSGEATPADSDPEAAAMLSPQEETKRVRIYRLVTTASVLGLIASLALSVFFSQRLKTALQNNEGFANAWQELRLQNDSLEKSGVAMEQELNTALNLDYLRVSLLPVGENFTNEAFVFWRKSSAEVLIYSHKLPSPPDGFQYQLWARSAGEFSDIGTFYPTATITKLKPILEATSFAVSLEPEGGSLKPTDGQMVMMGSVLSE